jgi:methylated-DNA-[protein]-cysteine S-methyltransferase
MRMHADDAGDAAGARRFAVFPTALGECGVAWQGNELITVLLPAADASATSSLLRHLSGGAAAGGDWPPFVQQAVASMQALLRGEAARLDGVPLAWSRVGEFERRVYTATQKLGPGETSTYGDLARELGDTGAARAVGTALGRNPWPLVVPCHRVLAAGGKLGGFSSPGGVAQKEKLLAIESVHARREGELF